MEPLTSSGVSLVSGWLWAARRAMAPARMLLRLIWRSGGGPPRGWPRTMMAQPDKTCGGEGGRGEEKVSITFSIYSVKNRRGNSDHKNQKFTWMERRNEALGFFLNQRVFIRNDYKTYVWCDANRCMITTERRFISAKIALG